MAKRRRRSTVSTGTDTTIEATVVNFAEDLGRILGTAQRKAEDWLGQRQAIADQLTQIRDAAGKYLHQLTGGTDSAGVRRRPGRPRMNIAGGGVPAPFGGATPETAGGGRKRTRRGMSAAQRKAVGERMKKYWAARRKAESK
jgi:hypothetical protein